MSIGDLPEEVTELSGVLATPMAIEIDSGEYVLFPTGSRLTVTRDTSFPDLVTDDDKLEVARLARAMEHGGR